MSKERIRSLEKRQSRLKVIREKVLNLKQERIEKLQTELLEGLDFDTTGWKVQWTYSRVEILGAVNSDRTYYRPTIKVSIRESNDYVDGNYVTTFQYDNTQINNFNHYDTLLNGREDYPTKERILEGMVIYQTILKTLGYDKGIVGIIIKSYDDIRNGITLLERRVDTLQNEIGSEISTYKRDIENLKVRPLIKKGVWLKRQRVDDNGRGIDTNFFHIFKITANCVFYNEFDRNGRNTRKEESYWNEKCTTRRMTHQEFESSVRPADYGSGVYITKEFTPTSIGKRTYNGFISKIEIT